MTGITSVMYYPGYSQVQVNQNLLVQTISTITNAFPMTLTTTSAHGYVPGMEVGFLIPTAFGMTQLNGLTGQVLTASGTSMTIGIDSTNFYVFAYPSPLPSAYTPPSVFPVSSGPYLSPLPLPYGNQNSLEGTIFNSGEV